MAQKKCKWCLATGTAWSVYTQPEGVGDACPGRGAG